METRIRLNEPGKRKPKGAIIGAGFQKKGVPDLFIERVVPDRFQVEGVIASTMDPRVSISKRESIVLEVVAMFNELIDHFSRDGSVLTHIFPERYGKMMYLNDDVIVFRWTYQMLQVDLEQRPYHPKQSATALDAVRAAVKRIDDLREIADRI